MHCADKPASIYWLIVSLSGSHFLLRPAAEPVSKMVGFDLRMFEKPVSEMACLLHDFCAT
jgi:hypothetical protein